MEIKTWNTGSMYFAETTITAPVNFAPRFVGNLTQNMVLIKSTPYIFQFPLSKNKGDIALYITLYNFYKYFLHVLIQYISAVPGTNAVQYIVLLSVCSKHTFCRFRLYIFLQSCTFGLNKKLLYTFCHLKLKICFTNSSTVFYFDLTEFCGFVSINN